MATTVTLDSKVVEEIKELTRARTKTEAVRRALSEYIRARRRRELVELAGKIPFTLTNAELESLEGS